MLSAPRPLVPSEYPAALSLWQDVFGAPPGYFERYYEADPNYAVGDTLGIWDGDLLVSAVHLCRRPVVWEESTLLCGGIANVATREEYRRQGLSRQLLAVAIEKMKAEGFHLSLLGTGTPGHYAALGWEPLGRAQMTLTFSLEAASSDVAWEEVGSVALLGQAYSQSARPLQFLRLPDYFEGWVGWDWRRQGAQIGTMGEGDYLVLVPGSAAEHPLPILEWRARGGEAELSLLQAAAAVARQSGHPGLWLEALPQHVSLETLQAMGEVVRHVEGGGMIRNITLSQDEYIRVLQANQTGLAAWWPGDGF